MAQDILARNNVNVTGSGKQHMVLAHGFGCDQHMWSYTAPKLAEKYRLVLFDHVGSGKSDITAFSKERHSKLEGYAKDLIEVIDAVGATNTIFVGHSVSGIIGILAAIERPDLFERLIMIAPSPCFLNHPPEYMGGFERSDIEELLSMMDKNFLGWANMLAPMIMQNPDRPELSTELEGSFCATDPEAAKVFARATFLSDHRHILNKLRTPALIMQCSGEVIAPLQVGVYLHEHMPNSTLRIMEATGHCPHISAPQETVAAIKEYLDPENSQW